MFKEWTKRIFALLETQTHSVPIPLLLSFEKLFFFSIRPIYMHRLDRTALFLILGWKCISGLFDKVAIFISNVILVEQVASLASNVSVVGEVSVLIF
jgi:hypothetical protein